jgi:hypothetical protein
LQRDRMLARVVVEQLAHVPADNGRSHDHLGVEQRVRRIQPMQEAAVPVGPVHHRGNADASIDPLDRFPC